MAESTVTSESDARPTDSLKVLLVADEKFRGSEFMDELRGHIEGRSAEVSIFVIAPALASSGLEHELASFDEPIKAANERLEIVLAELKGVGLEAVGQVGDGDPVVAIGDGLREFDADEIIVVGHREEDQTYGEKDLWKRVEHEFHQPIVELVVGTPDGDGNAPAVVDIQRDGGRKETEEELIERTRNLPPANRRDIIGMLVGFFGIAALALISIKAGLDEDQGFEKPAAAAILLLAIGAFLINVAHIVGLLFFQSVHYTGFWEKFMARISMVYTIGAVIAALILLAFV